MANRESYLLRLDPRILEALRRWSRDELRSLNGQIEYILRRALSEANRLPGDRSPVSDESADPSE